MLPTVFGGNFAAPEVRFTDVRFVICDPVANFKNEHFLCATGHREFVGHGERIRSLLVIIEHEMTAHGRNLGGKLHAQPPDGKVQLVNTLIAEVAVPRVPDPMPVVMEAILREGFERRGTGP